MNNDEKKKKLREYLLSADRLKKKCDDAIRWESLSAGPSGMILNRGGKGRPDTIKETAMQARQECEDLAVETRRLRQELNDALALMEDNQLRSIIEGLYIDGMSTRQLREKKSYSERHMRRLTSMAIRELDRCSTFFS
ncbi:hypothetical protein CAFE_17680 [Caprobacter fermentans]|uniref:Uncharacterized protein n=1 Tax=Caproicibacter fermentans TaxID=2576756 RepID=A0A6N8HZ30_9FIRM|nr:DUF1492 domain-containing protein [Caproicibacter fermentans]MVB11066.1 hypothetical protein [Caproicibacter fermentans]